MEHFVRSLLDDEKFSATMTGMVARKNEIVIRKTTKNALNNVYVKWQIADDKVTATPLKNASGYI